MPSSRRYRLVAPVVSLAVFILLACTQPTLSSAGALTSDTDVTGKTDDAGGELLMEPVSLRGFRPEVEEYAVVDAERLDMRAVFEDLGPEATLWYQHVQTLANPFFEGRKAGSRGMELAGEYVEFYMRKYGLEPAFPDEAGASEGQPSARWTSYRQPFSYDLSGREVEVVDSRFAIGRRGMKDGEDYVVLGNSGSGRASGHVTFVGYGIENGRGDYSSFDEDTDLSGRIALVLRYEPLDESGTSQWKSNGFSTRAGLRRKMTAIAKRGAEAIILVNPPGAVDGAEGLESTPGRMGLGRPLDIPIIQVTQETAEQLLELGDSEGRELLAMRRLADEGEITTADLANRLQVTVNAEVDSRRLQANTSNIGGVLRGRGDLADEWLIIGGHYDHVGYGNFGGDSGSGRVHPGADDNASGTAGVLLLARRMAEFYAGADDDSNLRSILFMAFSAEEAGLRGSSHYVKHPTLSPEEVTAMLNMDMIGRLRGDTLMIGGVGTADGFQDLVRRHVEASGLTVYGDRGGAGPSDHANFFRTGLPVLFFFTFIHPEYHAPGDRAYTVNPIGAIKVLNLVTAIATDLVTRRELLAFNQPQRNRGEDRGEDRGYSDVRLGIAPDMGADLDTGVLVAEVSANTGASEAGIQSGDILLSWNGEELDGVLALFKHLKEHKPGDVVKMGVQRDGKAITLDVKLKGSQGG